MKASEARAAIQYERLKSNCVSQDFEIEQCLGKAMFGVGPHGLPLWGEHTPVTLALLASDIILEYRRRFGHVAYQEIVHVVAKKTEKANRSASKRVSGGERASTR